jgi:hypothetical protein
LYISGATVLGGMSQPMNGPSVYFRTESRAQVDRWRSAARAEGRTLSAWARQALDQAAELRRSPVIAPYGIKHGPAVLIRTESRAQVTRWKSAATGERRTLNDWARHVLDQAARDQAAQGATP